MPGGTGEPAGLCHDRTAIGRGTLRLFVSHVVLVQRCNLTISTVQYCIFVQFNLNFGPGRAAENDIVGNLILFTLKSDTCTICALFTVIHVFR